MRLADKIAGWFGYARPQRAPGYAAADATRLTASLEQEAQFINTTLRYQGRALRARSRQAAQNNPFARRFVNMVVNNVCGPTPFRLQAKVKFNNGKLDTAANRKMEQEWCAWGKKGACEISGRFSWNALQRLLVRNLATDGELLIRRYRGPEYGRHGYQLQIVDVDRLDDMKNKSLDGGGAIHMGVEVDAQSRPVAYHILRRKPSQWAYGYTNRESDRVPAEDILHVFIPDFAEQVRGVPWMYAALLNLVHLGAFEEAAVIAARVGAAQMGFIQSPDGSPPPGDGKDAKGNSQVNAAEPGAFTTLPPGYSVAGWNPKYPDAAIGPFVKACLRGIAVGCDVAYHNLSGDMEGVNYSSARIAELDERDSWMVIQNFVSEHLHDDIHGDWLSTSVLTGVLPQAWMLNLEKYRDIYWQAKRWAWVDPVGEVTAALKANAGRIRSLTQIVAEGGADIEDVFNEIAEEEALAAEKKIELANPEAQKPVAPPAEQAQTPEEKALETIAADVRALLVRPPAPINVDARSTVTVPERAVTLNNEVNVPERTTTVNNELTVPERAVQVTNNVRTFPKSSVETIERDADKEISTVTRKNEG